jgi:hypothetical protein
VAWHPFQERLLAVGHHDGCLQYWAVGLDYAQAEVPHAHDFTVADVAWAHAGNVLASGSHDTTVKFWARSRPGDTAAQYAYQGNAMRNYPDVNTNLVPVPSPASSSGAGSAGPVSVGAYAGGLTARSFEEQEADRFAPGYGIRDRRAYEGPTATSAMQQRDSMATNRHFDGMLGGPSDGRPPDGYICNACKLPGHYIADCPVLADRRRSSSTTSGSGGPPLSDYVPRTLPGATYVCKLCGQRGDHWFQLCPNVPQLPALTAPAHRDAGAAAWPQQGVGGSYWSPPGPYAHVASGTMDDVFMGSAQQAPMPWPSPSYLGPTEWGTGPHAGPPKRGRY